MSLEVKLLIQSTTFIRKQAVSSIIYLSFKGNNIYDFKTYSDNCVLLAEHPKADSADDFSEIEFVLLYNDSMLLKTDGPLLFFTPMQNAASLISAGILYGIIIEVRYLDVRGASII